MRDRSEESRIRSRLDELPGLGLTEYGIGVAGVRLLLSGDRGRGAEISIERDTVGIAEPGRTRQRAGVRAELTATALLGAIGDSLTRADTAAGSLILEFGGGLRIDISADDDVEAWSIRSADHGLVVCRPGGDLAVWSPPDP